MEEVASLADTLRTAASAARMAGSIHEAVTNLRTCLGVRATSAYTDDLGACLDEVAGRVEGIPDGPIYTGLMPPLDRDGDPIYLGDMLYNEFGQPWRVTKIVHNLHGATDAYDNGVRLIASELSHVKPRTVAALIREAYELGRKEARE